MSHFTVREIIINKGKSGSEHSHLCFVLLFIEHFIIHISLNLPNGL